MFRFCILFLDFLDSFCQIVGQIRVEIKMLFVAASAPSEFKTYDELKEKLDRILGLTGGVSTSTAESVAEDLDEVPWSNTTETTADEPVVASAESTLEKESGEDAMDYFKKLAED